VVPRLGCDSIESVPFRSFTGIAIGDVKIPTPRPPATELSGVDFGPVPCPTRGGLASARERETVGWNRAGIFLITAAPWLKGLLRILRLP